ncbi:MAG: hypothetical protein H6741_10215 [Alphaproteobacteria bacterium]|nr:hypothetical protein [Alphaproteobacteria bacterium]
MSSVLLALVLSPWARAQDPGPDPALELELELAREAGVAAEAELLRTRETLETQEALWAQAAVLLDRRQPQAARAQAAQALGESGEPEARALLEAVALDASALRVQLRPLRLAMDWLTEDRAEDPEVRAAAVQALAAWPDTRTHDLALELVRASGDPELPRLAAVDLLRAQPTDLGGKALYEVASHREEPEGLRRGCVEALHAQWPALLEARGEPVPAGFSVAAVPGSVANAVAGATLLFGVGMMGNSDFAMSLGGFGGAVLGAGTGVTYAMDHPVTWGQSLAYTASVTGGLVTAGSLIEGLDLGMLRADGAILTLGTLGGVGVGAWQLKRDPTPLGVLETSLGALVGRQISGGAAAVGVGLVYPQQRDSYADAVEVAEATAANLGMWAGAALAGARAPRWELGPWDLSTAAVLSGEGAALFALAPNLWQNANHRGWAPLGWGLGAAAGLALAESADPSLQRGLLTGYGALSGHLLGLVGPALVGGDSWMSERPLIAGAMVGGVLGSGAGWWVGERPFLSPGDVVLMGIVPPLVAAETGALILYADAHGGLPVDNHRLALLSGAAGLSMVVAGLTGATADLDAPDVVLVGTSAVWGAWYGALTPLALGLDGEPVDLLLPTALSAAGFSLGGALLQLPAVGLEPRRAVMPQLAGVGGASLGALGVSLFTEDTQSIAAGAVIGSTAGLGLGALVEKQLGPELEAQREARQEKREGRLLRRLWRDLIPGQVSMGLSPGPGPVEDPGLGLQLSVTGW